MKGHRMLNARLILIASVLGASLWQGAAELSTQPDDWPQWRGRHRDGISTETGFQPTWPESGPKLKWSSREVGIGYGGPALVGNYLYILGDLPDGCHVLALERATGQLVWKTRVGPPGGNSNYPGPRATPTIDGNLLITMTQHGDVVCLELPNGRLRWQQSMEQALGAVRPMWHYGESPLVDGELVVCTPGGEQGTLAALDKTTGKILWRSSGITNPPAYSSVIAAEIAGMRQYIQLTAQNVFGVDAQSGFPLWNFRRAGVRAVVPTPLCADNFVYVTSGYGLGCNLLQIEKDASGFIAKEVYATKPIVSHHGGVVKVGNHVYGYSDGAGWTCQEFATGKTIWQDRGVGKGSVTYADGHLYCRSEDGPVALVAATPEGYREQGRFRQPHRSSKKAWPHPVVAGGGLYLRDQDLLLCYDIKAD